MEKLFSYYRLSLLVKRQWLENQKLFVMGIAVLFGSGVLLYTLTTNWNMAKLFDETQTLGFIVGLFLSSAIFTNYIFKDFYEKATASNFLLIPATHFEKLLAGIFYSLVVFPITFIVLFAIIDFSFVSYLNSNHQTLLDYNTKAISEFKPNATILKQLFETPKQFIQTLVGVWLFVQAIAVMGTISFGRWSFIKLAFSGFIFFLILVLINFLFHKLLLSDVLLKIGSTGFVKDGQLINIQGKPITNMSSEVLIFLLRYIFPTVLFTIAYFKLKEKQV